MKLFLLHIMIKDCLPMMIYFIIMRFNLTGETFLPNILSEFPAASKMLISDMLSATLFYNLFPMLLSVIIYYPIVFLGNKIKFVNDKLKLLIIGFLLTLTTPVIYVLGYNLELTSLKKAEIISWLLTFSISISMYYFVNKPKKL